MNARQEAILSKIPLRRVRDPLVKDEWLYVPANPFKEVYKKLSNYSYSDWELDLLGIEIHNIKQAAENKKKKLSAK